MSVQELSYRDRPERATSPVKDVPLLHGNSLPWNDYAKKMGLKDELEMYRFCDDLGLPDHLICHIVGCSPNTLANRATRKRIRKERAEKQRSESRRKGVPHGFTKVTQVFSQRQTLRLIQFLVEEWKRAKRVGEEAG